MIERSAGCAAWGVYTRCFRLLQSEVPIVRRSFTPALGLKARVRRGTKTANRRPWRTPRHVKSKGFLLILKAKPALWLWFYLVLVLVSIADVYSFVLRTYIRTYHCGNTIHGVIAIRLNLV